MRDAALKGKSLHHFEKRRVNVELNKPVIGQLTTENTDSRNPAAVNPIAAPRHAKSELHTSYD